MTICCMMKETQTWCFCDNREGWNGVRDGTEVQEEGGICDIRLIHVDVWQKPTRYYIANFPPIKNIL